MSEQSHTPAQIIQAQSMHAVVLIVSALFTMLLCARVLQYVHAVTRLCVRVYRDARFGMPRVFAGILTPDECAFIVAEAEKHAASNGGWLTDRHENYPTTDIDTRTMPALRVWVRDLARRRIFPLIETTYGIPPHVLGINEIFVAKYEHAPNRQSSLETHRDDAEFSFVVALNDAFDGGGTLFGNALALGPTGSVTIFSGQQQHQGRIVTRGTRYILTGFLNVAGHDTCAALV